MKKINIIIIALALIGLGYLGYSSYSNKTEYIEVSINDSAFSPEVLIIDKGTTVTWVNDGEREHWPASNFHPMHTLYPESGGCIGSKLDACKGLKKGESFAFKFNQVGEWPMHDHIYPGLTMVVKVVEKGSEVKNSQSARESLTPEEFRKASYAEQLAYIKFSAEKNPAATWNFLKEGFMVNGQVVGNAHEMAHIIGNKLYEKSGLDGIKACDTTFAFGCMHGVTEAMLLKEGIKKVKSIEEKCLAFFPPGSTNDYSGCIHGMGHGLFTFEGGDLKKSLAACDIVSEAYRQYCYDGVFMERSGESTELISFDAKNPWKFCADLDERYHRNCARYQDQVFLQNIGGEDQVKEVGKNCALGPSTLLKETCFESLGYYVAQSNLGNSVEIWKNCQKMPTKEGVEICTTGGAIETIFQKYSNYQTTSKGLCGKISEPKKTLCFDRIGYMMK